MDIMSKRKFISISIIMVYILEFIIIYSYINKNTENEYYDLKEEHITNPIIEKTYQQETFLTQLQNKEEDYLAILKIPKLNINRPIYSIQDKRNNVEQNIEILKESILPDHNNSLILLAAHSGYGYNAFFDPLDQLTINDVIIFIYNNQELKYYVTNIEEQEKNGTISINKEATDRLILTTCSKNNKTKQLIITAKKNRE